MRPWVLALASVLFAPSVLAQAGGENNATRSGAVVIPRFGVLVAGGGEGEGECDGSGTAVVACDDFQVDDADYDDESRIALGVDILGNVSGNVRLGGGLWFVPETQIEGEVSSVEWGSDLTLSFIAEGLLDLTPSVAFAGRLFGGGLFLFPGDDLEDANDALDGACNTFEVAGADCEVKDGPYLGPTFGLGVGVVGAVGRVALRGDFMFQWYTLGLSGIEASGAGGEIDVSTRATGTRFWLSGGVEF